MNLFVYGTLQRGGVAHSRLLDAQFAGTAMLRDFALYDLGWYPGILEEVGERVRGEAYLDVDTLIPDIDRFEGEGSLYTRRIVKVELDGGGELEAFAYIYNHPVPPHDKVPCSKQPWKGETK